MQFTSSAIQSISDVTDLNEVTIVFQNGKPYTYMVSDVEAWKNDLADVISESESVGSFVNRALRSGVLQLAQVAVWLIHWPWEKGSLNILLSLTVLYTQTDQIMFNKMINQIRTFGYKMNNPMPRKIFFLNNFAPKRYAQFTELMYTLNTQYQLGEITEAQVNATLLSFWFNLLIHTYHCNSYD